MIFMSWRRSALYNVNDCGPLLLTWLTWPEVFSQKLCLGKFCTFHIKHVLVYLCSAVYTWIDGSSCQSDDTETSVLLLSNNICFKEWKFLSVHYLLHTTTTLLWSVLRIHTLCYGLWCTGWGASCFWCMVVYQNCSHVLHFWLQKLHRTHTFYCVEKWFMIITT